MDWQNDLHAVTGIDMVIAEIAKRLMSEAWAPHSFVAAPNRDSNLDRIHLDSGPTH